jgi:hypothetical protein
MPLPKTPNVDLTDDNLVRIMRDPNFTIAFPFLATAMARAQGTTKKCGGCGRKKRANRHIDFNLIRRQIVELPVAEKGRMKALLNTNQVIIHYLKTNGQKHKIRF